MLALPWAGVAAFAGAQPHLLARVRALLRVERKKEDHKGGFQGTLCIIGAIICDDLKEPINVGTTT